MCASEQTFLGGRTPWSKYMRTTPPTNYFIVKPCASAQKPWITAFFFFFFGSLLLSSSTRRRFYPQRSSRQAVVTGVVPSPPWHVPSIFIAHRVQHSHCSSNSPKLTLSRFPLINFLMQEVPTSMCTRLGENSTREIDFSRHEDTWYNLPSHRGRRLQWEIP